MEQNTNPVDMTVSRAVVNGAVYDVIEYEDYAKMKNNLVGNVAVPIKHNGETLLLPAKGKYTGSNSTPGVYSAGPLDFFVYPNEPMIEQYLPNRMIEFSNRDSMKEILEKQETIMRLAEPWITSPDNITKFPIAPDDQPEMRCLKMALNEKNVDFDKYAPRFGANFPNDKRQLKNKAATLNIIKRFCENMDMSCDLVLKDRNPNVANPMGKEIRVSITDVLYDEEEE